MNAQDLNGTHIKEIEAWRTRYACNQRCNMNDGPDEECPAHGRTPEDLWAIIGKMSDDQRVGMARIEELEATLQRVRDLHRRTHAVFSWQSGTRYETPCPDCDGAPGRHDCGCWADQQLEYVCAECHRLGARSRGVSDYTWPCPTIQAIEGDQT